MSAWCSLGNASGDIGLVLAGGGGIVPSHVHACFLIECIFSATISTIKNLLIDGFVRLTKGPDKGCYFRAFFRQNHKHLVHLIKPGKPTTDCSSDSASSPSAQATAPSQSALEGQGKIPFRRVGDLSLPEASVGIEDANGKGKKSSVQFTDQDDDDVEDYCEV